MEQYYSWGGASNPEFYHKVNVNAEGPISAMMKWCEAYDARGARYYVKFAGAWNNAEHTEFQFETEEPAVMFALKFGAI